MIRNLTHTASFMGMEAGVSLCWVRFELRCVGAAVGSDASEGQEEAKGEEGGEGKGEGEGGERRKGGEGGRRTRLSLWKDTWPVAISPVFCASVWLAGFSLRELARTLRLSPGV